MKRALLLLLALIGGLGVGGGSAWAVGQFVPGPGTAKVKPGPVQVEDDKPPEFVPAELLVPLVFGDGELAGYANVKLQLRITPGQGDEVKARLPLLLNAVNLQTYRTPLAAGADGRLPDLTNLRALVQRSADAALGRGTIRQVAITEARTS